MTPNLLPLYIFSFAAVTLLTLFARRNKRSGWVKERVTFVDDLRALKVALDQAEYQAAPAVLAGPRSLSVGDAGAFTTQLSHLQGALAGGTTAITVESTEAAQQTVAQ